MAAKFAVLSDGTTATATAKLKGDVGGFTVQLTDNAIVHGNVIASAPSGVALNLGDDAHVTGKCVTGGGSIEIVSADPAKCIGGQDTSGSDPLLTELSTGLSDAATLAAALSALTPTTSLPEIDLLPGTKMTMVFPAGTSVVAISGRMLIEPKSKLTVKAPAGSSVIFLVGTLFSTTFHAKITLAGGIKASNVAYVVNDDVTLGTSASVMGTILAPTSNCMLDFLSKLKGALLCGTSVTFSAGAKLTFDPLPTTFP
jgi:choice-of-anchor A domain-containing protein